MHLYLGPYSIRHEPAPLNDIYQNRPYFFTLLYVKILVYQKVMSQTSAATAGTAAAVITSWLTGTVGAVASTLGFSAPGVTAATVASSMMSASATTGIGASAISALQSAGALFVGATGGGIIATTAAIAAPVAIGAAVYNYLK